MFHHAHHQGHFMKPWLQEPFDHPILLASVFRSRSSSSCTKYKNKKKPRRRFYLTGGMMNFHSFTWGKLKWAFSELCFFDVYLWNTYKLNAFNIFSSKALIISCEILITTVISNVTTNKLTIYAKLCQNVTIFCLQEIASLFPVQEKWRACSNLKCNFSSSCFIAGDIHVVFDKNSILRFSDYVHLLKYSPIRVPQNCFGSFHCTN